MREHQHHLADMPVHAQLARQLRPDLRTRSATSVASPHVELSRVRAVGGERSLAG